MDRKWEMSSMLAFKDNRMLHKVIIFFGIAISSAMIIVPWITICVAELYTFYNTDDFILKQMIEGLDSYSWIEFYRYYYSFFREMRQSWTGSYIEFFLGTLSRLSFSNDKAEIVIKIYRVSFFFISSFIFSRYFFFSFCKNSKVAFFLAGLFCWLFINSKNYYEAFFWGSGLRVYVFVLGCLLISIFLFFRIDLNKSWICCVFSSVFAVLAMGGTQIIITLGCYLLLIHILSKFLDSREINLKQIIVFSVYLICGFFNCFAPGNFERHGYIVSDQKLHFAKAILWTLRDDFMYSERLFKDTNFPVFFLIIVVLGTLYKTKITKERLVGSLLFFLSPMAALFPAVLGYNTPYMPNRIIFVVDYFIIIRFIIIGYIFGTYIRRMVKDKEKFVYVSFIAIFVLTCANSWRFESGEVYKLIKGVISGELSAYKTSVDGILSQIEISEEADVVTDDLPPKVEGFIELWYTDDPAFQGNEDIARYYNKDSVRAKGDRQYIAWGEE